MPLLANLLLGLFGQLFAWFAKFATKRVAFYLAMVAGVAVSFAAMKVTIQGIVSGLSLAMPSEVPIILSWIIPSNWDECLAAYVAARTAVWAFKWAMNIQLQGALSA